MDTALACTASMSFRSLCAAACGECRHLMPDRRRRAACFSADGERRRRSNLIPAGFLPESADLLYAGGAAGPTAVSPRNAALLLVSLLLAFNLLDILLTIRALSLGFAEANPFMAGLFSLSVPMGMLAKFILVGIGALLLWRLSHLPLARRGMAMVTGCYGVVVAYHLFFQLSL